MFSKIQRYIDDYRGIIRADLFVSVGADSADGSKIGGCPIATFLSKYKLRRFSSPFDWLLNVRLSNVSTFLQNNGDGFFANIKEINPNSTSQTREIKDINTGMVSPHDFPRTERIDEYYPRFIQKHKQRFQRLINNIKKAKRVVFISRRDTNISEFKLFLKSMQRFHSAEYIFVNIRHNEKLTTMTKNIIDIGGGGESHYRIPI